MEPRIFHGTITPDDIAHSLIGQFNRGNYRVQQVGEGKKIVVQIATTERATSGGQTALTVTIQGVEDGVSIQMGNQNWLGIAASFGVTAFQALRNPFSLLGRLDDLAQDIESVQLSEEIWKTIELTARQHGASQELSERLRRSVCPYCSTANPFGESSCIACGAPLGDIQPNTCSQCGFVLSRNERFCPNCGKPVG